MTLIEKNNFDGLIDNIFQVHDVLQSCAAKSVNQFLTIRNWIFGYYIVEYEQNGDDRAKYGENLIANIASKIKHIKGLTGNQLYTCLNFYQTYPYFLRTIFEKLRILHLEDDKILRTLSVKLQTSDNNNDTILRTVSVKLDTPIRETMPLELQQADNDNNTILRTVSPELLNGDKLHPELLLSRLNFSHFIELIRVSDSLQRLFYEVETIKNNWSVRELKRAIGTQLAFRTTMSTNKEAVIAKIKNLKPANNHVLIDLKMNEFDHSDAGQMNLYLNYYKANEMCEDDNPPVGIILCADKDDTLVEYSTAGMDDHLFVSKYLVNLPQKKVLEAFIRQEIER